MGKKKEEKVLRVKSIKNGVVIDHIAKGKAPEVLRILGIGEDFSDTVTLAMNVDSKAFGKKDIVKVENRELSTAELNQISLISPNATINKIKDYKVVKKELVKLPSEIIGSLRCSNPNCISSKDREGVRTVFIVKRKEPLVLYCKYCERTLL
jgi:aspartate carbamoyltransferase regulatory subunit